MLKRKSLLACFHVYVLIQLLTPLLLDHKVVDLFVHPIYALCQMMAVRMEQKPCIFCVLMTLSLYQYISQDRVWAEPKQTVIKYIILEMFFIHALNNLIEWYLHTCPKSYQPVTLFITTKYSDEIQHLFFIITIDNSL